MRGKSLVAQIVVAVVLYAVIFTIGYSKTEEDGEQWWIFSLAVIACHIYLSLVLISERELGAMFFLGQAMGDLESGPYFALWPIVYIRKETKNIVQLEIGTLTDEERKKAKVLEASASVYLMEDPLHVNWGDMKTAGPSAFTTPDEEKKMYKGNPYGEAMVTDTHVTVRFRISSLTKLITKAGSLAEGIELIQGVVKSTLVSQAGKSFVGRVIREMEEMDEKLRAAVEEFVVDPNSRAYAVNRDASWGVDVEKTQITRVGTARRINVAIADKGKVIYTAQGERVRLVEEGAGQAEAITLRAEADRIRLEKEGAGRAEAERLLLIARRNGIEKLAEIAGVPAVQIILQLEALERGLQAGKAVIVPMELSRILGSLGDRIQPPPVR